MFGVKLNLKKGRIMKSRLRGWTSESVLVLTTVALVSALGQSTSAETIVDNQDSGFTILGGTWSTETSPVPFGPDYRSHEAGSDTDRVRFTPDLPLAGVYQVLLTWPDVPTEDTISIAPDAPFTIDYATGIDTISVNQQNPPIADFVVSGTGFELLGVFSFLAGTSGHVELSADASGIVMADAVLFKLVPEPGAFALAILSLLSLSFWRRSHSR
jgi:hypothetical protein